MTMIIITKLSVLFGKAGIGNRNRFFALTDDDHSILKTDVCLLRVVP